MKWTMRGETFTISLIKRLEDSTSLDQIVLDYHYRPLGTEQQLAYYETDGHWDEVGEWLSQLMENTESLLRRINAELSYMNFYMVLSFLKASFPQVYEKLILNPEPSTITETGRFSGKTSVTDVARPREIEASGSSGGSEQSRFEIEADDIRTFESRDDYLENG